MEIKSIDENSGYIDLGIEIGEMRKFHSKEDAIAHINSIPQLDTIIIITPPPH